MRIRSVLFEKGAFYHIFNHAAKGELLFRDPEDYQTCISLMQKFINPEFYAVCAYCLMPNHYHILLRQLTDNHVNKPFFQIWQRYSRYYNHKYNEVGSIFRQKLQHAWVSNESHLLNLCAYIHLNPVSAKLVDKPDAWSWSDYLDWVAKRNHCLFNPLLRDLYFANPASYQSAIQNITWGMVDKRSLMDNTENPQGL